MDFEGTMKPKETYDLIKGYKKAIFFRIDVATKVLLSKDRFKEFRKIYEIAFNIEAILRESGYPQARGFGAGSCKPVFCKGIVCQALVNGGPCLYPSIAKPSMEAVGIDVFSLAKKVGWDIHYIGRNTDPESLPKGMLMGLVLFA
jgi:predicted metal-binding protein